jgi:hypothetical protein
MDFFDLPLPHTYWNIVREGPHALLSTEPASIGMVRRMT